MFNPSDSSSSSDGDLDSSSSSEDEQPPAVDCYANRAKLDPKYVWHHFPTKLELVPTKECTYALLSRLDVLIKVHICARAPGLVLLALHCQHLVASDVSWDVVAMSRTKSWRSSRCNASSSNTRPAGNGWFLFHGETA